MATLGDFDTFGGKTYRFETGDSVDAFRRWYPWGVQYSASTLAGAKALVDISGDIEEKVVILTDTGANESYLYVQKSTGYSSTFDLSFDAILGPDAVGDLATLQTASDLNTAILSGILNADLTDAKSKKHTQNTDTGTTASSFIIQSGGITATLDASNLTGNATIDLNDVKNTLDDFTIATPIISKTVAQLIALTPSTGDTYFASDVDSTGFPMTYNGTDWASGVYWIQDGSSTIASSPSVNTVYHHLNSFWICTDATASQEIFMITQKTPIEINTANHTLTADEMYGGAIYSNTGATGAVVLTSDTEVEGMHIMLHKDANQNFTFNNSGAGAVIANTASETDKIQHLYYVGGAWVVGEATGTWA